MISLGIVRTLRHFKRKTLRDMKEMDQSVQKREAGRFKSKREGGRYKSNLHRLGHLCAPLRHPRGQVVVVKQQREAEVWEV